MTTTDIYRDFLAHTGEPLPAALLTIGVLIQGQTAGPPPPSPGGFLTIKEAAREFNLSERALYRLTDIHRRNGRSIRIRRADLERVLAEPEFTLR